MSGCFDKILSFLDCHSFVKCRLVCRTWKNYIDNEWSMLQLQIFHLTKYPKATDPGSSYLLDEYELNFGPLMDVMKENKDKSELRVFINMCRDLCSSCFSKSSDEFLTY